MGRAVGGYVCTQMFVFIILKLKMKMFRIWDNKFYFIVIVSQNLQFDVICIRIYSPRVFNHIKWESGEKSSAPSIDVK